jgi:hypothetical protein
LGATEAPKAVGVEVVGRALVGETKEGGGRECSGWLERNGKKSPATCRKEGLRHTGQRHGRNAEETEKLKKGKSGKRMQKSAGQQVS